MTWDVWGGEGELRFLVDQTAVVNQSFHAFQLSIKARLMIAVFTPTLESHQCWTDAMFALSLSLC